MDILMDILIHISSDTFEQNSFIFDALRFIDVMVNRLFYKKKKLFKENIFRKGINPFPASFLFSFSLLFVFLEKLLLQRKNKINTLIFFSIPNSKPQHHSENLYNFYALLLNCKLFKYTFIFYFVLFIYLNFPQNFSSYLRILNVHTINLNRMLKTLFILIIYKVTKENKNNFRNIINTHLKATEESWLKLFK